MNNDATTPTIGVHGTNGTPAHSIARDELALVIALPPASRKGHIMAGFPYSLIGLASFVDAGCRVLFTNTTVIAFDRDGKVVLEGGARPPAPNFGAGRSSHKFHRRPLAPSTTPAWALRIWHPNGSHQCSMLHHLIPAPPPCQATVAANATFSVYSDGFDSWLDAIKAGNCDTFDGLTYSNVARYCPDSDETILGHLAQTRQNVRSSKPPPAARPPLARLPPPNDNKKEVFIEIYPLNKLYSDDTGQFPVRACSGNQYVMIAYHMEGNLILQQAFPTKADKHSIPAFNNITSHLTEQGLSVDLNIRDNKASTDLKRVITETWRAKFQLVPPDMHRRNTAERMIRHFKNHFLSILAGVDAAFPPYLWDLLLPQAELTINLLRQAAANPKISA